MTDPSSELDKIEAQHRQTEAYGLRLAGATYQQIADRLGYADAQAAQDVVVAELNRQTGSPETHGQALELARLDAMLLGLWSQARRGDASAIDRVLKISERRAQVIGNVVPADDHETEESGLDEFTRRLRERKTGTEDQSPTDQ